MAKLTRDEFKKLQRANISKFSGKDNDETIRIIIGVGTCGVAAGARETQKAFEEEISAQNIEGAVISETGCMGLCHVEPTVEIRVPGMPSVIYGNVDADAAKRIVLKHIQARMLINDHIYDKPSMDIITTGGQSR